MKKPLYSPKIFQLAFVILSGVLMSVLILVMSRGFSKNVHAAPIPPPDGYPKLRFSAKTVTPTLASVGGATLYYEIEIRNTGSYIAQNTSLTDAIPASTTYNGDATASSGPAPSFDGTSVHWMGDVGFDTSVYINFSVDVSPAFEGTVVNTAVISQSLVATPVTVTADAVITDQPILTVTKTAVPDLPGANKPLTYTLVVQNLGQPGLSLPVTVVDHVPADTTFRSVGPDGTVSPGGDVVTWMRVVTLGLDETSVFTFSVDVNDVPSGTVITNDTYWVSSTQSVLGVGQPYTVTVVDPILSISKQIWPDPPGSNRELTYTLTVLNQGSLATSLVITDRVPAGVTYVRGGSEAGGLITWNVPQLDTGEFAQVTFTVYIGDIADITILNDEFGVCSAEGVCATGAPITNVVEGPTFEAFAYVDPIAKKPGGGGGPVTPTLVVKNLGPGNAIDAYAILEFYRISVQGSDLYADPPVGTPPPFPDGPVCGDNCNSFLWVGDLNVGEVVSFTTYDGQNTIGGEEGTRYTATVIITDSLSGFVTMPVTGTAGGKVTHLANLIPTKSAPPIIGSGQLMTYTFNIWNSALSTDEPPAPWLTDTVPTSVTVVSISDGGVASPLPGGGSVVSWTLPSMGPGATTHRSYVVQVDSDLVSGTLIVNDDYRASWYEIEDSKVFSNTGQAVTTTVQEVGLIDSFKVVTPTLARPGENITLTYFLNIVNSGPLPLSGVTVSDWLPWQDTTYQRDAIASSGQVVSDIVSVDWTGSIAPFSSESLTMTVVVDPNFEGAITNTAVISHADLAEPVVVHAVAYITDNPVLQITKTANPDPVPVGEELLYTIKVENLGQQATGLVVTDTIPADTVYVPGSATGGGQLVGDQVDWNLSVLPAGGSATLTFRVTVGSGADFITNSDYGVRCAEGVFDAGPPVITAIDNPGGKIFLPIIAR